MSLPTVISRNGRLLNHDQATLPIFSPALTGAYGVYESIQVAQGIPFAAATHCERLRQSAGLLGLALPGAEATWLTWIDALVTAEQPQEATLRLLAAQTAADPVATLFAWLRPAPQYPATYYRAGAPAITFPGQRYLPQAKSLNTLLSHMAQRAAQAAGVHEALLHHAGFVTEGSNSNLFAVQQGRLITAPATHVLSGVTRDIVLPLADQLGIIAEERALPLAEVGQWTEVFITSSSRHIMPIHSIDGQIVGGGSVGPITQRLMNAFELYFRQALAESKAVQTSKSLNYL